MISEHLFSSLSSSLRVLVNFQIQLAFICVLTYVIYRLLAYIYITATTPSGIHYVNNAPRETKMNIAIYSPFVFHTDIARATFSKIKCILKCDGDCYVRALWGVPVFNLVQFLHKEWQEMINQVITDEPEFPCRSIYADRPFVLADNVEETIEFQAPTNFEQFLLSDVELHRRTVYPFVLLMVLNKIDNGPEYLEPHAIAVAYVFHLPNNILNKVQFIGQFSRSSSGMVGQLIKIYRCSGDENSCIICFQEKASVVQLSCRHCCACRRCYEKCTKCPICRNTYMDFFEIPRNINQHR